MLLRGPSGAGKSSLALRACEAGWRLVADDRVLAWASEGRLFARAPRTLAGLVEARGLGVLPAATLGLAPVTCLIDLAPDASGVERLPEAEAVEVAGIALPRLVLWAHDAAATAKLDLALNARLACAATSLGVAEGEAYQARRAGEPGQGPGGRGPLMRNR